MQFSYRTSSFQKLIKRAFSYHHLNTIAASFSIHILSSIKTKQLGSRRLLSGIHENHSSRCIGSDSKLDTSIYLGTGEGKSHNVQNYAVINSIKPTAPDRISKIEKRTYSRPCHRHANWRHDTQVYIHKKLYGNFSNWGRLEKWPSIECKIILIYR